MVAEEVGVQELRTLLAKREVMPLRCQDRVVVVVVRQ